MPEGTKSAVKSTAVWGAAIAMLAGLAPVFGYTISSSDQEALTALVDSGLVVYTSIASLVGGAIALYGRVNATKKITTIV